eukprot:ANDGO_05319.mRNA.1 hypothetical protein
MLLVRDVPKALLFWNGALGLTVVRQSEQWAQLSSRSPIPSGAAHHPHHGPSTSTSSSSTGIGGGDGDGGGPIEETSAGAVSIILKGPSSTTAALSLDDSGLPSTPSSSSSSSPLSCPLYSPFLSFNVRGKNEFDSMLVRMLSAGAALEGPVKFPAHGRVAALRSPDGHLVSIHEPASDRV